MLQIHFVDCLFFAWLLHRFITGVQRRMAMIGLTFVWVGELTIIIGGNVRLLAWIAAAYLAIGWITVFLMIYTTNRHQKQAVSHLKDR